MRIIYVIFVVVGGMISAHMTAQEKGPPRNEGEWVWAYFFPGGFAGGLMAIIIVEPILAVFRRRSQGSPRESYPRALASPTGPQIAQFCHSCGSETRPDALFCDKCGVKLVGAARVAVKSKRLAGLLGVFLGPTGAHRFYLGYTWIGIAQVVVTLVTYGIGGIWGIVEGILILTGRIRLDAKGRPLMG